MYLACKKLHLVVKCFSFAEKDKAMNNMKFEHICNLICMGEVESVMTITEDDNKKIQEIVDYYLEYAEYYQKDFFHKLNTSINFLI